MWWWLIRPVLCTPQSTIIAGIAMAALTAFVLRLFFDANFTNLLLLVACSNAFPALFLISQHWDLRTLVLWLVSFALSGLMRVSTFLLTIPGTEPNNAIRSTMESIVEVYEQLRDATQDIVPRPQPPIGEEAASRERQRKKLLREKRMLRMRHIRRYIDNKHPSLPARSNDQMKVAFLGDGLAHHGNCVFDAGLFNERGDGDPGWLCLEEEEKRAFLDSYGLSVEDVLMHAGKDSLIQVCDHWGTLNFDDHVEWTTIDNHWPAVRRAQTLLQQNNHTDTERRELKNLPALLVSLNKAAKHGNWNYDNSDAKRKKDKKKAERRKQLQKGVRSIYEGNPWAVLTDDGLEKDQGSVIKPVKSAGSLFNGTSNGNCGKTDRSHTLWLQPWRKE